MAFGLGTIVSLAGQVASGIMSKINNDKMERQQKQESARREAYYTAKANENPLSNSRTQQILHQYDRDAKKQIDKARGVAAITGATPEYSLAVQKGVAEGRAKLMSDVTAGATERHDKYEDKAEGVRQDAAAAEQERLNARNETFANLAANAGNAFGAILDGQQARDYQGEIDDLTNAFNNGAITEDVYNEKVAKVKKSWGKNVTSHGILGN